ncbi:c-type cytochrome biogenesis protein CcmI [Ferrovibrio sp.]|uniref:c-type cytochrome biogenesis protein CcmI n=1 Tax=Ferrovibrio sp. TaxID=1917215 RepID=UPI0035178723
MMLWLGFILLVLVAAGFLLWPLLRSRQVAAGRRDHDLAVYRAQLAEVEQDLARNTISGTEAAAARLEIQRRLLRADTAEAGGGTAAPLRAGPAIRFATLSALLLVPLLGGGLYLALGRPEAADFDRVTARARAEQQARLQAETETLIARLRTRLQAEPDLVDGWLLLGRSLLSTDRPDEAAAALDQAVALQPDNPEALALRGEARTLAADGAVTPAAEQDFQAVLSRDPEHPGARYYLGLARLQEGDTRGAYDDWHALAAAAPADAPWLGLVQGRLRELAPRLGIPLATAVPEPRPPSAASPAAPPAMPGPDRAQVEAAQQMSEAERTEMIRGMVDRLAARLQEQPADPEGWLRLARARQVLGEAEAAREALRQAVQHGPDRVDARMALAFDLAGATVKNRDPLPGDAVAQFQAVLGLQPDHAQALWFVGRAAYESGDKTAAAAHWQRLLALLPPDSAEAKELAARIASLTR